MKKTSIYAIGSIIGVGLTLSLQTYATPSSVNDLLPVKEIKTFAEVYGQIKANYYENTEDARLIENAMKGMVSGLDPHSEYLNQEDFNGLMEQTTGKFGGLGIEIVKDESFIKIVTPIEDTPAFRAGLKPNDYIIKIDSVSTKGMSTMEASKKMRGKPGTYVTLTIVRKDELKPFDLKLKRDTINIKTVKSQLVEPGIGYIRVNSFKEQTLEDFVEHINALTRENGKPLDGLVFDLRNNGGGLLNSAVGLTAVFIPENSVVVSTKGRDNIKQTVLRANKNDYRNPMDGSMFKDPLANLPAEIKKLPITLLVNGGSASASEIVTGALQDYQRAVVVGTRSFGKGSVQTIIPLGNNDGIKLTVALYYTPKDRSIQARGIVPDIIVKTEDDDFFGFREVDFNNHLSNPKGEEVKGSLSKPLENEKLDKKAKEEKTLKIKEKILKESSYNYMPDPKQDIQLKKSIEITKNTAEWKKALGRYKINERKIVQEEKKDKKD
ncbi:MAG: PDZ domain-containing protein [Neisseriaceae bacterium]|nr:MAG: PDZ domain-containing protein [Neisseriaceae bacterium]